MRMYLVEDELNKCTMDLRVDADYVYLANLADVHVGAAHHHTKKFVDTVNTILKVPNFFVIIGGDSTESSGMHTKSSVFEENKHGYDQVKEIRDKLRPIKDRILFVRSGNHGHERAMRNNKMAPEEVLADLLDVPYFKGFGAAIVNARKNSYVVTTQHNSKKPDKFQHFHSDINFFEHKHLQGFEREMTATVNRFAKKWTIRDVLNVQSGSFLSWGGYAMDKGYKPLATGCPVVEMSGVANKWGTLCYENIDQFKRAVGVK